MPIIVDEDKYDRLFARAHRILKQEYKKHEPQKGDSWKKMPVEELQILYENTFILREWILNRDYRTNKLIDRILLELMILERKLEV